MQLEAGVFRGESTLIDMQDVLIINRKSNLKYFSTGSLPNHIIFLFPINNQGPLFNRSVLSGDLTQIVFNGNSTDGVNITPTNCEKILVALKTDSLAKYLSEKEFDIFLEMTNLNKQITVAKLHKDMATSFVSRKYTEILNTRSKAGSNPLLRYQYCNTLIRYLNDYLASIAGKSANVKDSSSYEKILDRAIHFICSENGTLCSLEKISQQIFASKRNIQYAFSTLIDMTPTQFSRLIKLNQIRNEFLKHNENKHPISQVMNQYQISNSGRFRHEYFDFFKEFPKDTIARSAP